jgi:hypothetical protein
MVALGRRGRGPPPRRPVRSNMDLRQTAINPLSYQRDRVPKLRPPAGRHRGSEPRCANVHAAPGPAAGPQTNGRQGWSAPTAKTGFVDAEPTPSRFPADRGERPRRERPGRGRVASCTNFLLAQAASRAALHVQIGSRNMTSVSSSNFTELAYGVLALKPAQPTGTARQLRRAARAPRTASAVVG